jgi:hypothetical protein
MRNLPAMFAVLCLLPLSALAATARPPHADFYVAPDGRDTWSGRMVIANRAGKDGPFATVARAVRAVRELRTSTRNLARPVVVMVRGGFFPLQEPLRLGPEDSGTAASPTVFAAYLPERNHPVISGGELLTGWTVDGKGWWHKTLPEVAAGKWRFQQLWIDGERRYRSRQPKSGYYQVDEALPPSDKAKGKGFDRFRFRTGDIRADWHNLADVEVLGFQIWTMARLPIASVDEASRAVNFTGTTSGAESYQALPKGNRYLVENVREALASGEFYLDRTSGELIYAPMPGENPKRAEVIAPRLESVLELRGDAPARKFVSNIRFEGITFAHTNWVTPPAGNAFAQAEINLGGAVSATGARDCVFGRCEVSHTGAYAVELGNGCKRNVLRACRLEDLGAGGVKIGMTSAPDDDELVASDNTVESCVIAHGGRLHPAAVGVWIGHAHHNTIRANEIADLYYTGISVGWSWGYNPSLAHHNVLERNYIHDIGQGVLSDMGGIYTLGLSPGTVERGNRIHDVDSFSYGGWGIYPDEGSTGILIEDNVVFRTKSAPFHQHYGKENVIRNNIFAFGREAQVMRTRAENHLSFTFEHNIVLWNEGPLLGSNWSGDNYKLDYNDYWNAANQPITFAGMSYDAWKQKGQDVHSVIADPGFVDPPHGDFRLKPGSTAEKIGFRPIDPSVSALPKNEVKLAPPAYPPVKSGK